MSCRQCEEQQHEPASAFYRWKNANIEIRGCDVHLREIFNALNHIQQTAPHEPKQEAK